MWSCWAPMVPSCHYNELPLLWSAQLVSMSSKYCDRDELTICIFVNIVIALSWSCCDNQEITPTPLFFIQICTHTPTQSRTVCIAYTLHTYITFTKYFAFKLSTFPLSLQWHFQGNKYAVRQSLNLLWHFPSLLWIDRKLATARGALLLITVTSSALKDTYISICYGIKGENILEDFMVEKWFWWYQ